MDKGKNVKYRTKYQFGKRRRKGIKGIQCHKIHEKPTRSENAEPIESELFATTPIPQTSASEVKLGCFKRKQEDSDEDIDKETSERASDVEDIELEAAEVNSPSINMIVNLGCLQSLVKTALCPRCREAVRCTPN